MIKDLAARAGRAVYAWLYENFLRGFIEFPFELEVMKSVALVIPIMGAILYGATPAIALSHVAGPWPALVLFVLGLAYGIYCLVVLERKSTVNLLSLSPQQIKEQRAEVELQFERAWREGNPLTLWRQGVPGLQRLYRAVF